MPATATPDDLSFVQHAAYALQLLLGAVFVASVVPKLRDLGAFARIVAAYEVLPARAAPAVAGAVVAAELFVAGAFLAGALIAVAVPLTAVLLAAFASATWINLRRGRDISCGCFGQPEERISAKSLARLGLLAAALAAFGAAVTGDIVSPVTPGWLVDHEWAAAAYAVEIASLSAFLAVAAMWSLNYQPLRWLLRGGIKQ